MYRYFFFGLLVVFQQALAVPSKSTVPINMPDFAVKVIFDDTAKLYFLESSESVIIAVSFADFIGPTGNYLGNIRQEVQGEGTIVIQNIKFDPKKIKKLRTLDYEVLVNVYSGRRSTDKNILDCELVQDVISKLQNKVHEVHCELGSWATAKHGKAQ